MNDGQPCVCVEARREQKEKFQIGNRRGSRNCSVSKTTNAPWTAGQHTVRGGADVVCSHTLTVLALGAWMRGCRSALLSPFQLRALGLLARIRPTCGLFLGFLEIRSAHRSNASWTCSETGTADCWLSPPPVGSMCRVRGLERAPRGGRYPDELQKGPRSGEGRTAHQDEQRVSQGTYPDYQQSLAPLRLF
jgi:hypothetical protein